MTFSVIVPVYNVEKYLAKCLESILNQTYTDFEIIVVNDGSPDNSQQIIDEYAKKYPEKIKPFVKENGGLSSARNFGTERASGEYLLFVDSDDYISKDLLQNLYRDIEKNRVDIIRFSAQSVLENGSVLELISAPEMSNISGQQALGKLIDNKLYFEPACFYAYRTAFWKENNFQYSKGRYHEDYGLTPEVIIKAKSFTAITFVGYFYVQTATSIMRGNNYEKTVIKSNDIYFHTQRLWQVANENILDKEIKAKFGSYIANAAINQADNLRGKDKKTYIKKLKENKTFDMLLNDTFKRKIKKIYIKLKYGVV